MYIDKLYNKLFSTGNIDGLKILFSEIRLFTDSSTRAQQLINIINQKKQKGEDFSKEMAELQGLNAPKSSSLDISKSLTGAMNTLNTANNGIRLIGTIGDGLAKIGSFFK